MTEHRYVLVVCAGNTCRSPMAEALLRHAFDDHGIALDVRSAGLDPTPGQPVSRETLKVLESKAATVENHRSRGTDAETVSNATAIFCMEDRQCNELLRRYPHVPRERVHRLADMDISDPICEGIDGYLRVRQEIEAALPNVIKLVQARSAS